MSFIVSTRFLSCASLIFFSTASFGEEGSRCSGETNLDPASPCFTGGHGFVTPPGFTEVQEVIVIARRIAPDEGSPWWYQELINRNLLPIAPAVLAASPSLGNSADLLSPLQPTCAVATALNPIQTPDQDAAGNNGTNWWLARNAIVQTFSGNWGSVWRGHRVDVKYPNGDTVRFIILDVSNSPNIQNRDVILRKYLSGVPSGERSPCM